MESVRSYSPTGISLPRVLSGSAPASAVSGLARCLLHFTACRLAKSPKATLYIRGFSGFVTSTTAPIATGRSEPVPGRDFQPAVDQRLFTAHQQKQASPHTIASYRDTFRFLFRFTEKRLHKPPSRLTLEEIDAPLVTAFINDLEKTRSISPRSRNLRLTAIRSFFRYAGYEAPTHSLQIQRMLAIPGKRYDRGEIHFLSHDEMEALLGAPERKTWSGRRDHALLMVAIQTGLRLAEPIGLKRQDAMIGTGAYVRCTGKGRGERCTPLAESKKHKVSKVLCQVPSIGPIRAALLIALIQTPRRFRTKRPFWKYTGFAIEMHSSANYRSVKGELQRSKKRDSVRGLNRDCNHDLKNLFKSAATVASVKPGPFQEFYAALVAKGMRPEMARLTLARKTATIVLIVWKRGVSFDAKYLKSQTA